MFHKIKRSGWIIVGIIGITACTDDYDPIGNNKPATKLKMAPRHLAFDGAGATLQVALETNAPELQLGNLPDWIETASFNEDKTALTVQARENQTSDEIRTGVISVSTVTGEQESTLPLAVIQAGKGARLGFDGFTGALSPGTWVATDDSKITSGAAGLVIEGAPNGIGNSLYYQNPTGLVVQSSAGVGNAVTMYVDVKADPGVEGGLKAYYNPLTGEEFKFFFVMNADNQGAFYAFRNINGSDQPLALADAIPGPGMAEIPVLGERDEFMRIEFTNVPYLPNWWQSEVNVYSLQTRNGETRVLAKHFSRKFEIDGPKPDPGYFGLWGRFGQVPFKNFTLSAQNN